MLSWLIVSVIVVIVLLVLQNNQANLLQQPGIKARLKIFLTSHQADISRDPVLPELRSPVFQLTQQQVFEKLPAVIEALGWQQLQVDAETYSIKAVVSTPLIGFKDDVEIVVMADAQQSYINAVSRSRIGRADFAANSHHLQQLLMAIEQAGWQ